MTQARIHGALIFDHNPKHTFVYPHRSTLDALEILYAPNRLSADEYILEYLEILPKKPKPLLVTSDNELAAKAKLLHVQVLSISDFFLLLSAKTKHGSPKEKPSTELPRQIQRYLSLFDKKE